MTLPLKISPCSQGVLHTVTRWICTVGGIAMAAYFISRIVAEGHFQIEDVLFVGALPCLCISLSLLHVEIDREHISKTVRLGALWRWEYSRVRWDEVRLAEVYRTSRREYLNLKLTTNEGRHVFFSLPNGSVGASRFCEVAKCFTRDEA